MNLWVWSTLYVLSNLSNQRSLLGLTLLGGQLYQFGTHSQMQLNLLAVVPVLPASLFIENRPNLAGHTWKTTKPFTFNVSLTPTQACSTATSGTQQESIIQTRQVYVLKLYDNAAFNSTRCKLLARLNMSR